ncbi:MFS transporter [Plantactinospora sp. ZYX-F-223]|uniref:MFS transporter n=1 Tax=Plantactinospora sp. ZYX-F-223 TaxID=3144103 RepID=UPI0031FCF07F
MTHPEPEDVIRRPGLPDTFRLLFAGVLINRLGLLAPSFLTLFLVADTTTTTTMAGGLIGVWGGGSLLGALAGGAVADRASPAAAILTAQTSALTACGLLAIADQPLALGVATFLAGFASTLHKPASAVIVATTLPATQHIHAFGLLYWAANIGAAISPIICGVLLEHSRFWLLVLNASTAVLYACIATRIPRNTSQPHRSHHQLETPTGLFGDLITAFRHPPTARFLAMSFCLALIYLQKQSALPLDMRAHGVPPTTFGLIIAINAALIIAAQPLISRISTRLDLDVQFLFAATLIAIGFGTNMWATAWPTYALAVVIWTAGELLLVPQASAFLVRHAPPQHVGSYQGAYHFVWNLGLVAGAPLGMALLNTAGSATTWAAACTLGLVVAASQSLTMLLHRRTKYRGRHTDGSARTDSTGS